MTSHNAGQADGRAGTSQTRITPFLPPRSQGPASLSHRGLPDHPLQRLRNEVLAELSHASQPLGRLKND